MSDIRLPRWASWSRTACRALIGLWVIAWLIRGVLELSNLILDTTFFRGGSPAWLELVSMGLFGASAVSGVGWLAGAVVAGYREPR